MQVESSLKDILEERVVHGAVAQDAPHAAVFGQRLLCMSGDVETEPPEDPEVLGGMAFSDP